MTANTQLGLLQKSLAPIGAVVVSITVPDGAKDAVPVSSHTSPLILNNQVVDALNKIVWNTYATSVNTAWGAQNSHTFSGVYAQGGWINGGIPGRDSVPILAMQDEFMVNSRATRSLTQQFGSGVMDMINMGRLPNTIENNFSPPSAPITNVVNFPRGGGGGGNAELIAEVKALKEEVKKLREENTKVTIGTSNQLARGVDKLREDIGENVDKGARRIADQSRMNAQQAKQRGG
jgi:hypothetical protein